VDGVRGCCTGLSCGNKGAAFRKKKKKNHHLQGRRGGALPRSVSVGTRGNAARYRPAGGGAVGAPNSQATDQSASCCRRLQPQISQVAAQRQPADRGLP
jgi:hypothetical protein